MEYVFNDCKYSLEKNIGDIFDYNVAKEYITDYFINYDYILVDQSYNKLRYKGFCLKNNPIYKSNNSYDNIDSYIKNYCATGCKYYLLKKVK